MAGNIKGITIEFRGDTTQLDKAIRKVESEARGVDKQLRQVDRALKFNPKNVELLTQKQSLLKQKVNDSRKAVEDLKDMQNKLDAKGVDKNSKEYMELRRKIIEAESKLKHFEAESRKLANVKLTALGKQIEDVGRKAKSTGDAMTKYITGPIVAAGAASGVAWTGTVDSLNTVTKLTGATGKELADMQNLVKDMAKSIPADMDTIANAVGEVNTRFGLTGQELEDVSSMFVKFAAVNGTDVITSIDQVQKVMSGYGIAAEDAGYALDVLTRTSQVSGVSIDRLTAGLIANGAAFQGLGLDIEESSVLMSQLEKSGANMETVTNGLRKALKYSAAEGVNLNDVLIETQEAILNDTDAMESLDKAYDVFGKSGDQMYKAIRSGALDFTALGNASLDAEGALETTFANIQSPATEFQKTLNSLKLLGYEIANAVMPYVSKAVEGLTGIVQRFMSWWSGLAPGVQKTILAIVAAIALIGPALSIVGTVVSGFGTILTNVGTVIGAFSKALAFLAANPVVLVVAGIAALVAGFIHLWRTSEEFRNFFINAWAKIKTAATNAINWIITRKNALVAAFKSIPQWFSNVFRQAWANVKAVFAGWAAFWSGLWEAVKARFAGIGTAMGDAISGAVKSGINSVIQMVENIINKGISLINSAIKLANKLPGVNVSLVPDLNLPRLAEGGVLSSARAVIAGEAGPEAIIPLEKLFRQMEKMNAGGGDEINIVVNPAPGMDVNDLARAVEERLIAAQKRRRYAWQ